MKTSVLPRWARPRNVVLVLVFVGLGIAAWMLVQHDHHPQEHAHHNEGAAGMTLNNGQRWETDVPLRTGMQRIRDAVEQTFVAHANNHLTSVETKALSATVQENVNYLIENCKLAPEADATLHVLITEMLSAAAHLAQNPSAHEGLERMEQALRHYPAYFNHLGWRELQVAKR